MKRPLDFISITIADFIVRSAYQMGKTPLLPIFAATLGATGAVLGFIVSVSTLTGMVLKPVIGLLSDRWGRRWWLIVGTFFFAGMPFLYRFIHSPEHLFGIRVVHGLATAIYGPVTLAFVVEQTETKRAEQLGWFGIARHAGYIVGPAVAGWLLLNMEPVSVFTIIGGVSLLAFIPILYLKEPASSAATRHRRTGCPTLHQQTTHALKFSVSTPAIWLSGGLESTVFVALYAAKAFLPIYALELGMNVALVGMFFSFQEAVHVVLKPFGGRLGDTVGYLKSIFVGIVLMGITLCLLTVAHRYTQLHGTRGPDWRVTSPCVPIYGRAGCHPDQRTTPRRGDGGHRYAKKYRESGGSHLWRASGSLVRFYADVSVHGHTATAQRGVGMVWNKSFAKRLV